MTNKGGRCNRADDPARNAGISLPGGPTDKLIEAAEFAGYKTSSGRPNKSQVVRDLIEQYLPSWYYEKELEKSRSSRKH